MHDYRSEFGIHLRVAWCLRLWSRNCGINVGKIEDYNDCYDAPSFPKFKPEEEWLDCLSDTSPGIAIDNSPSSLSCSAEYIFRFSSG